MHPSGVTNIRLSDATRSEEEYQSNHRACCNVECTKYDPRDTPHTKTERREAGVKFLATGSPVRKPEKDVRKGDGAAETGERR